MANGRRWWLARVLVLAVPVSMTSVGALPQRPSGREPAAAETPDSAPPSSPVSIRINAVVTDRAGRPILDLRASDFALQDNGIDQKIESAVLKAAPSTESAEVREIQSAQDEARAAREPDTRVFAIFLDEFHVAAGDDSERVRTELMRFVDRELRPRDLLFVMKPLDAVTGIRFVRDRDRARAAIGSFSGRRGDYTARTPFEEQFFGRAPNAVEGARAQVVLNALRELTMRMGDLGAARAALVLVAEDFAAGLHQRRLPDWQAVARAAGHFQVPIYTFDPRDTAAPPADSRRPANAGQSIMPAIAAETGGEAVADASGFAAGLARMSRALDNYYVLTYQPAQATDGTFHSIQVRTTRKDARIRVPTGYWSPLSSEWREWLAKAAAPSPARPPRVLRRSPLIDTWIGFERGSDGRMRLIFTWEAAPASAFRRPPPQTVVLKATTTENTPIVESEVEAVRAGPEPGAPRDRLVFEVPVGRVQLDMTIRGADGSTLDIASRDVEVPQDRGARPVLLPLQIIRARTARDFRLIVAGAATAPSPSREFSRTERLLIRAPAFDPKGSPVTVSMAIVNSRGQRIRDIARLSGADDGAPEFDLPLSWLPPDEYGIEIVVVGASGSARQLVPVRITG